MSTCLDEKVILDPRTITAIFTRNVDMMCRRLGHQTLLTGLYHEKFEALKSLLRNSRTRISIWRGHDRNGSSQTGHDPGNLFRPT